MTEDVRELDEPDLVLKCSQLRTLVAALVADPDRACDVEQEVWLSALQSPMEKIKCWKSWCRTVALNLVRGYSRKNARRQETALAGEPASDHESPESVVDQLHVFQDLNSSLEDLKEPYKSAVVLRFLSEMTPLEIAEIQGVPASTVRSRIARGLEQLRGHMDRRTDRGRSAWALSLIGLLGLKAPTPVVAEADLASSVTVLKPVTFSVLGGLFVNKVVATFVFVCLCAAAWIAFDFGDDNVELDQTTHHEKGEAQEQAPRRAVNQRPPAESMEAKSTKQTAVTETESAKNLVVSGVVESTNGRVIEGARIAIRPKEQYAAGSILLEPTDVGDNCLRRVSDAQGQFNYDDLKDGAFECLAHAEGYRPHRVLIEVIDGKSQSAFIRIPLEPLSQIACVVLDDKKNPVAGASVRVQLKSTQDWEHVPRYVEVKKSTDAQGTFCVADFPRSAKRRDAASSVIVHVDHDQFAKLSFKYLDRLPKDNLGRTILQLERGRTLELKFRDVDTGNFVGGFDVKLNSVFGTWTTVRPVTEDGALTVAHAPTTPFAELILLSKDWTLSDSKKSKQESTRILRLAPSGDQQLEVDVARSLVVKGQLVAASDGAPLGGVKVRVAPVGVYDPKILRTRSAQCTTDKDGKFELRGLGAESVVFSIHSDDWVMGGFELPSGHLATSKIKLERDNCKQLKALAAPASTISGMVRDEKGQPVPGALVAVRDNSISGQVAFTVKPKSARTDEVGRYTMRGVSPGEDLQLTARHAGYAPSVIVKTLAEGESLEQVDFVLNDGALVEVHVVDAAGRMVSDVRVEVRSGLVGNDKSRMMRDTVVRSTITSPDRPAYIERLAVGAAEIILRDECRDGQRFLKVTKRVKLSGGKQTIKLHVGNPHLIRGVARQKNGQPIANARLRFKPQGGSNRIDEILVKTDANGRFVFEARKPSKKRPGYAAASMTRKLGGYAKKGEVGFVYELLQAEVWELKHPSKLTNSDTTPLSSKTLYELHPRDEPWELIFQLN